MSRRFTWTILTTLGLLACYGAYALTLNRLLTPPQLTIQTPSNQQAQTLPQPKENLRQAETFLPDQAWVASAKYQMRTETAFIYANRVDTDDARGAVVFEPLAVIFHQRNPKPGEPPITILAERGVIQFERKLDLSDPDPGKIMAGALENNVTINGPNELSVTGRNFVFSEPSMKLYTDRPLSFRFGKHSGSSRGGGQVDLISDSQPGSTNLDVTGIRNVQLRRDVAMDLMFQEDDPAKEPMRVQVRCAGVFNYNLEQRHARFENEVQIFRPTAPGVYDSLECATLDLHFTDPQPQTGPAEETEGFDGVSGTLAFRSLRATGETVKLISQGNRMSALLTELTYDMQTRRAVLKAPAPRNVRVWQDGSELWSPQITLDHNEKNDITQAECTGPGTLVYQDPKTKQPMLSTRWAGWLRKLPGKQPDEQIVELHRQAMVEQPEQATGMSAEFIKLWLKQTGPATRPLSPTSTDNAPQQQLMSAGFVPDKLLATENVMLISPQMLARTKRLEVWFQQVPARAPTQPIPPQPIPTQQPQPSRQSPAAQQPGQIAQVGHQEPAKQPAPRGPGGQPPALVAGQPNRPPMKVSADTIRVRITQEEQSRQSHLAELWIIDQVQVTQPSQPGEQPLQIVGQELHIENRDENDQTLNLKGSPARLSERGYGMEGKEIHLNRGANLANIAGAGTLRLPMSKTPDGQPLGQPRQLEVWWSDEMTFDGQEAVFFGNVRTMLEDSQLGCQKMKVQLTDRLSFTQSLDEEGVRDNLDIRRIYCLNGVTVNSHVYLESKLVEIRRASFHQLAVDQQSGETEAQGPGWVMWWNRNDRPRPGLAPNVSVRANQPADSDKPPWEYARIDFVGKNTGNLKRRMTRFEDSVRIVYGPVDRPLATIDPEALPKDGGWMKCQTLTLTHHEQEGADPAWIEMLGSGNAELEGRTFFARADRISFNESTGLYTLLSYGNRRATIWRETEIGKERTQMDAQRMEFNPARNQLNFHKATNIGTSR